ncbi:MAG: response regulator [bacterium]|nr:response regulator [bacterium]
MNKAHILVVDDEEDIREIVTYNLSREGYRVIGVENAERALAEIHSHPPDAVVLDIMLPGDVDGLDLCRKLKSSPDTAHIPVIMLTARTEEADVVSELELDADDYITKPFSPRVLSARVRAVLRRKQGEATGSLSFDALVIFRNR